MSKQAVLVKKYGGTSVGSPQRIRKVAADLAGDHQRGLSQVVVVSAMARTTDRLLALAREVSNRPHPRELDMLLATGEQVSIALLAMAMHERGVEAVSLTGAQCGIVTDGNFSRARIRAIRTDRIEERLRAGHVVFVAGFQGVTDSDEITTLGRGGSDTTATALAAALGASRCQIFTDVEGVFTADPRIVPEARLLPFISYSEMLEYAASGSKVLHPRCVEIANRHQVPLQVLSSFAGSGQGAAGQGTTVVKEDQVEKVSVTGVTYESDIARVALTRVRDFPGVAALISERLAQAGINIRLIIQGLRHDQSNDVSLVVDRDSADRALQVLQEAAPQVGAEKVEVDREAGVVAIIGSGVASVPGVAATFFRALADEGINIELISSSEVRIACIIRAADLKAAVRSVHHAFKLDQVERRLRRPPAEDGQEEQAP
ncbi:MAG TPA: aspartate kinase [Acidobacteriota bacterium]|nr:aspartate kinase [Acidobacteriota bacterium]